MLKPPKQTLCLQNKIFHSSAISLNFFQSGADEEHTLVGDSSQICCLYRFNNLLQIAQVIFKILGNYSSIIRAMIAFWQIAGPVPPPPHLKKISRSGPGLQLWYNE